MATNKQISISWRWSRGQNNKKKKKQEQKQNNNNNNNKKTLSQKNFSMKLSSK